MKIMQWLSTLAFSAVCFMSATAFAAPLTITLGNGEVWTGELNQKVTVTLNEDGKNVEKKGELTRATDDYIILDGSLILLSDVVAISGGSAPTAPTEEDSPVETSTNEPEQVDNEDTEKTVVLAPEGDLPKGVFVLPLHEMVGTYFRPREINQLVDHIDEMYGPGQIIVLDIDSGGGSVRVWSDIRDTIFNARTRHRFIAWIQSAGSGAASTAFLCDEIYYRSDGNVGAITMYSGSIENVAPDWKLYGWIEELQGVLAKTSHTPAVAGCMVKSNEQFSYSVDPETGVHTYFYDSTGDHKLSQTGENLMLSAEEALSAGLSDGTADNGAELAALLDLDEWIEYDTFGRDIAAKWKKTLDEWGEVKNDLYRKFSGDVDGSTAKKRINNQIKAGEDLLRWAKKLGETAKWEGFTEERLIQLKTQIENLEHEKQQLD
jgi:membrane-bound ClpP family serine protease